MMYALVSVMNNLVHQHVCAEQQCHGKNRVKIKFVLTFSLFYLVKMLRNQIII